MTYHTSERKAQVIMWIGTLRKMQCSEWKALLLPKQQDGMFVFLVVKSSQASRNVSHKCIGVTVLAWYKTGSRQAAEKLYRHAAGWHACGWPHCMSACYFPKSTHGHVHNRPPW